MIFAVLICISIAVLGAAWVLYRRNMELFLCLLIAINFEFFYLPPPLAGADNYKLVLLPIISALLFECFVTGKLSMGRYGWWVLSFMAIAALGVIVAWSSGQGLLLGIKAAKFIPLSLVYFLLAGRKADPGRFSAYFILMALAVASLAAVSILTHGAVYPFRGMPGEMLAQSGKLRVTAGQFVISSAAVMGFARYRQTSRIRYLVASAALAAEVLFVQQTRGFILTIFASMFVVFVLSRDLTMLRVSMYLVFAGLCLAAWMVLSNADLSGIGLVKRTQEDISRRAGGSGGSLQARLNSYDYYWKDLKKHMVTGRGMLNFNWGGNRDKHMQQNYGIHLSDIGVMDFLVQAGLIGGAWLLYGLLRLWKDILLVRRHLVMACYFILGTLTMPTIDMFFRYDSLFLFAVFLGLSSGIIMSAAAGGAEGAGQWTSPS